jgi:hypothetical protein
MESPLAIRSSSTHTNSLRVPLFAPAYVAKEDLGEAPIKPRHWRAEVKIVPSLRDSLSWLILSGTSVPGY